MSQNTENRFFGLFGEEWYNALGEVMFNSFYWRKLGYRIARERKLYTIYPEKGSNLLFKAFRTTPLSKVKVIILGQDPYHNGSYDGFAFSNKGKTTFSPSLVNIFKEVEDDLYDGFKLYQDPDLERWAKQGVLLINTAHTVIKGNPGSHLQYWEYFTKQVILLLQQQNRPIVWMLWGKKAENAVKTVKKNEKHLYLISPHPSPYSAGSGFFGSKPFSKANKFLKDNNNEPIIHW